MVLWARIVLVTECVYVVWIGTVQWWFFDSRAAGWAWSWLLWRPGACLLRFARPANAIRTGSSLRSAPRGRSSGSVDYWLLQLVVTVYWLRV